MSETSLRTTLDEINRRRRRLWAIAVLLVLALAAAFAVTVTVDPAEVAANPALRWGTLAMTLVFLLFLVAQERVMRSLLTDLEDQTERSQAMQARAEEARTLAEAARAVNSTLEPAEVLRVLLDAAIDLTSATVGAVHVRVGDTLRVVASRGAHAVAEGSTVALDAGVVGRAAREGQAVVAEPPAHGHGVPGLALPGDLGAAAATPLVVEGRVVGTLAVQRARAGASFETGEVETIALLAEYAAAAVSNATRFDRERKRVEELVDIGEKRTDFIRAMVHDLRTPLAALQGYASVLNDRGDRMTASQRDQAVVGIVKQSTRLQRMITEVLDASKAEAGGDMELAPVDILRLLSETRETVEQASAAKGSQRKVQLVAPTEHLVVSGDDEALRHVFTNLVENAVKYSPPESPIVLRVERVDSEAVVHVTDRGEGIAATELPHVFDRFRQSGQSRAGGVGLGLYIVRALTQAHGGRVWVSSTLGEGTTFSVALPLRVEDDDTDLAD